MVEKNVRWLHTSDVVPMFPTFVWKIQLEERLCNTISARTLPALSLLRTQEPPLRPGQGWQSVQTLHMFEEFQDLISPVREAAAGFLKFLRIGYDVLEITACWASDVGDQDSLRADTSKLQEVLDAYGIQNTLEIYSGTHTSEVADRFQNHVLPFFSRNLCFKAGC